MDTQPPLQTLPSLMQIPALKNIRVKEILPSPSQDPLTSALVRIIDEEVPLDPFYITDLGILISLYHSWLQNLPTIRPFFPVRCNPDRALLATLAALGAGFDCASRSEITHVLSLAVSPDRILFSNPCKAEEHIKYAAGVHVNMLVFDSVEELDKVRKLHPQCSLLLHIHVPDRGEASSRNASSSKSGALIHEVIPVLRHARELGLNVVGISFEPEGSSSPGKTHGAAMEVVCNAFQAFTQLGLSRPRMLNVGGGFCSGTGFVKEALALRQSLQAQFPYLAVMSITATPGKYLVSAACMLVTNVIGKRVRGELREYWINDGVYGSMNGVIYHRKGVNAVPFAYTTRRANPLCKGLPTFRSTVFGPTCDALDTVFTDRQLPELGVGDWLVFPNMGAYAHASATNFNGFCAANIHTKYVFTNPISPTKG